MKIDTSLLGQQRTTERSKQFGFWFKSYIISAIACAIFAIVPQLHLNETKAAKIILWTTSGFFILFALCSCWKGGFICARCLEAEQINV